MINLEFTNLSDLADSPDTEISSKSPAVSQVPANKESSTDDSSDQSNSEEEQFRSDVEENSLVADYLKKVTPEIAREFQVC